MTEHRTLFTRGVHERVTVVALPEEGKVILVASNHAEQRWAAEEDMTPAEVMERYQEVCLMVSLDYGFIVTVMI